MEELIDDEIGIKIFLLVCIICGGRGLLLLVNDKNIIDFLFGLSKLIVFGNGLFGLRFNMIDVVLLGCFIVICLGGCVFCLIRLLLVKLVCDIKDDDWLLMVVGVVNGGGGGCFEMLFINLMSCRIFEDCCF